MELWTEYEGRTIDGTYPLVKLLEPEGRSAFFSTTNGTGKPTVIRLIESHFDDEEILARWRGVAALDHANLIKLKTFGQVDLDGTSLVYAVMEPAEANLGEILRERRLTALETRQVAESLTGALAALHGRGFVHEHVEPGNVLAVGETIKLRSDCVREAPEGEEGHALMQKDVHDLAVVLLRALTQQRTLEAASRELPLAEPFDQIVKKGIAGEWGLAQIGAALVTAAATRPVAAASPVARPVVRETPMERPAGPVPSPTARSIPTPIRPSVSPIDRVVVPDKDSEPFELGRLVYGIGSLLILLLVGWLFVHGCSSKSKSASQTAPVAAAAPVTASGSAAAAPAAPVKPSAATLRNSRPAGNGIGLWRVVAYTYNREDQAKHKAEEITQSHPDLKPEVFTPNGRAPYLVTVGGGMSRDEAFAFSGKAKREGMPRDIYAQNYRNR